MNYSQNLSHLISFSCPAISMTTSSLENHPPQCMLTWGLGTPAEGTTDHTPLGWLAETRNNLYPLPSVAPGDGGKINMKKIKMQMHNVEIERDKTIIKIMITLIM